MHFYKVTAVRKFFFFLDARRRGRIAIKEVLCSPILQELLDLRRPDLSADDLRSNWFSQESAAQRCSPYISPYLPHISCRARCAASARASGGRDATCSGDMGEI